jgi:NADH-quinone oxidoreductase subunit L
VVTWVGAITALTAASIAVAQSDIKRILAYSTISQLGYMMLALGVGGYVAGIFHLITHAFFKALLFLGAGSVIHGCHQEQDIRRMGGLRRYLPITFATYAIGMMSLAGVPLFFSGFWSKDEILHQALAWPVSRWPFYMGLAGAFLTAFYMTRQMAYIFWGVYRGESPSTLTRAGNNAHGAKTAPVPHESPAVMWVPLVILAIGAIGLGFLGTPFWPWFDHYLTGHVPAAGLAAGVTSVLPLMVLSTLVVGAGMGLGWAFYGRKPYRQPTDLDSLEHWQPTLFGLLRQRLFFDEGYDRTVGRWNEMSSKACAWLDHYVWENVVQAVAHLTVGLSWVSRLWDDYVVNGGFDAGCEGLRAAGHKMSGWQDGQVQHYLRAVALALALLLLLLAWGGWA